jgi:dTDP-4-dehydrorhamnose reductase
MKRCVIGATGLLGRALMNMPNTIACPVRFEESSQYRTWFDAHPDVDTIWHVARACRKNAPRRDIKTHRLEIKAMEDLVSTRASECKFVYASTKIVYGITHEFTPLPAHTVAEDFVIEQKNSIVNLPRWKTTARVSLKNLGKEHRIYATTKLRLEQIVRQHCDDHKIVRIWDII